MSDLELPGLQLRAAVAVEPVAAVPGSARARVKPIDRSQLSWRAVDVERLIEQDHPARAIWDLTGGLALEGFYAPIEAVEGVAGRMPWDPRLLISLWLYAYSRGISSAREVARRCEYEPAFQWLCGLERVNHHTLSDFRVTHQSALKELFVQILAVLNAEGLISLERVMHDGTKIRGDASAKSFRTEEALSKHLQGAREQVEALLAEQSDETTRQQAAQQRAARERVERVEKAMKQLEGIRQSKAGAEEKRHARASMSDPEARVMKQAAGGYAPSYNVQLSTEASHKIVVAVEVSQQRNDYAQLTPAVEQITENFQAAPRQMVVDGGFTSRENIMNMAAQGIDLIGSLGDGVGQGSSSVSRGLYSAEFSRAAFEYDGASNVYRCPAGETLKPGRQRKLSGGTMHFYHAPAAACQSCRFKAQCCPKSQRRTLAPFEEGPEIKAFRQKMETPPAREAYKQRAGVAEFPNAWIKEKLGLRRFRVRGLLKVKCEALWAALTYNIQQWIRICWLPKLKLTPSLEA
jgi:transposase